MATAVFCTARTFEQAQQIVNELKAAGFQNSDISVLMPNKHGMRDFTVANQTKAPEGTATGISAGAVIGGALGWLAGIGSLAIPGLGPFIAAGPIMAALSGAAAVGAVGGLTGALIGMGIPEFEAKHFEGRLKGGRLLISVHSEDSVETTNAKEIFHNSGAEDISTVSEPSMV